MATLRVEPLADGFSLYRTLEGDLVDQIAFRFYGTHDGTTEGIYSDNPGLLDLGLVLPAGVNIRLRPLKAKPATKPSISLWD